MLNCLRQLWIQWLCRRGATALEWSLGLRGGKYIHLISIMKKISIIVGSWLLAAALVLPVAALAEDGSSGSSNATTTRRELEERILMERRELQDRIEQARKAAAVKVNNATGTVRNLKDRLQDERKNFIDKVKEERENFVDHLKAKREAIKKKLGEERLNRIGRFAEQMFHRFEEAIDRLGRDADRISERLDKLAARGVNVAEWRADLDVAKTSISGAVTKLEEAKLKLVEILNASDPKKSFEDVRRLVAGVRDALKKAHADLVKVIREIKQVRPIGTGGTATSTATTTTP